MESGVAVTFALIYALAAGSPQELVGRRVESGQPVPAAVRGLLLPGVGVVQLAEGAEVELLAGPGAGLRLRRGSVRVSTSGPLAVELGGGLRASVSASSEALLTSRGRSSELCSLSGRLDLLVPRAPTGEGSPAEATAGEDEGEAAVEPGTCVVLEGGARTPGPAPAAAAGDEGEELRRGAEPRPEPPALPDVVGDLEAQRSEVEGRWSESFEQGPRREAQSCGCSEGGGSSGGLDPTGSTQPTPEPERPRTGALRVRVTLPGPDWR